MASIYICADVVAPRRPGCLYLMNKTIENIWQELAIFK